MNQTKYAVVDLEATSANSTGKIIQVGIAIVQGNDIIETYQTDVNPHEPLTDHIIELTGISDEQLALAPDFSEVAKEIYDLIEDCVFVAHNVKFDANLLAEELFMEGFDLRTARVDTVELSQIFFPTLEKYNLSTLSASLDIKLSDAHTAISDALATAELLISIKKKIASLPTETIERILDLSHHLIYETYLVIEEALLSTKPNQGRYIEQGGILVKSQPSLKKALPFPSDIEQILQELGLEKREKQEVFIQLVKEELNFKEPSFIEAQAGIGKTFGYLLSLLSQTPEKEQIIVSVPTKILQDQIMEKEAHLLEKTYQIPFHSLKSPASYIKLDTFAKTLQNEDKNRMLNRYNMQLLVWLLETETGDLDEIKQKQRYEAYFNHLKHDGQLSKDSNFYDIDFWKKSYDKSQHARVIITNHAYLLTRIDDDKNFVANKKLVIDEAQKFFLALESFSTARLNMTETLQWCFKEMKEKNPLLRKRLLESLYHELSLLLEQYSSNRLITIPYEKINQIQQDISELEALPDDLSNIFNSHYKDYWFEQDYIDDHRVTILHAARLDFLTGHHIIPDSTKSIFVSATISISRKVNLPHLLGYETYRECHIPTELQNNQVLFYIENALNPMLETETEYDYYISKQLMTLRESQLPILCLFTSKKSLLAVSALLDQHDIYHLAQDKNGTASNIKRRFDRGEAKILLGTGSFWEGVDFVNQSKIIQVISRIPFDNPEHYFSKKLNRRLRQEKKNPFYDYTLPLAVLKMKQAIGRTKRTEKQKSAVIFLDKRMSSKRYSRQIKQSLKEIARLNEVSTENILHEIKEFMGED